MSTYDDPHTSQTKQRAIIVAPEPPDQQTTIWASRSLQALLALAVLALLSSLFALIICAQHDHEIAQLQDDINTLQVAGYTSTPTTTLTPTVTSTPTVTLEFSLTPTLIPSPTPTPTLTMTLTLTPTPLLTSTSTATPTSTPTQTPFPTATPDLSQGACSGDVIQNGAEVKAAPDPASITIEVLTNAQALAIYERDQDGDWFFVYTGETFGWIHFTAINIRPDCISNIPISTPTP
ncbi:MAG: hypothetical protein K8S97_09780 [Anaerolineae bacterium]|nr:hypothetical protein [Anaerolineae bacterium]